MPPKDKEAVEPASWADKVPADMTNDELAEAKDRVESELGPMQEAVNNLASAKVLLDREVAVRFRLATVTLGTAQLPAWPESYIVQTYGSGETPTTEPG